METKNTTPKAPKATPKAKATTPKTVATRLVPKGIRMHIPEARQEAFVFEVHARERFKITAAVPPDELEKGPGHEHAAYTIEGDAVFPPWRTHNARVKMAAPALSAPSRAMNYRGHKVPCVEYKCAFSGDTFALPAGAAPMCVEVDYGYHGMEAPQQEADVQRYVVHPALGALGEEAMREALAEHLACALHDAIQDIWILLEKATLLGIPWDLAWPQPYARHSEEGSDEASADWTLGKTHRDTGKPFCKE